MKKHLVLLFMVFINMYTFAQNNITVTGKVTETGIGEPVIGASVIVIGTTSGTVTSIDGDFSLPNVSAKAVLQVSFLGMKTVEIPVNGRTLINIELSEDLQALDEVVVVGYGTAKLKDLTSPIANVKGDDLSKHATGSPMQALQGKVPGVQVISRGEPGSSPQVRIRGVGTTDTKMQGPLYVVDGMFFEDIAFLSNNDIEDMSILKDASASAIYGVRAANGVVLITTKKGVLNSKPRITYDGYVGFQRATNVLKMANSEQYATMQYEKGTDTDAARIMASVNTFGGNNGIPSTDTDWYDELLRTAMTQNQSVNITGGTEKAAYSIGLNYFTQDGIMDANNDYERFNIRTQADYRLFNWMKVGANVILSNSTQQLATESAWRYAFINPPTYPVYSEANADAKPVKFGSPAQIGYSEYFGNPVAAAYYYDKSKKVMQILPTFYAEIYLLPNKLTLKSSYNQSISLNRTKEYTPVYTVGGNQKNSASKLVKTDDYYQNYILDNVLTYRDQIGQHSFSAMLGNSLRNETWSKLEGSANNVPGGKDEYMYIGQGDADTRRGTDDGTAYRGLSYFGRVTYDYASKYLLSATFRADGSSKYQEKWGYFPSVGAGWVISEESFMKDKFFDFLKLRASWGKLGNDKVPASDGFASIKTKTDDDPYATTGIFNGIAIPGYTMNSFFSWLAWEVVTETNVGVDFAFFNNRLNGEIDYFHRTTSQAVINADLPMGQGKLLGNSGEILNEGFEFTLNWNDKVGKDFKYNIGLNLATLNNEIKSLVGGLPYIYGGSAEFRTISKVGSSIDAFYGHEVIGVYQTQEQVNADPVAVANGLKPGDFIYRDVNSDGKINDEDRVIMGSYLPDFTFGGNIGFAYKNIDFSIAFQGQVGNKIVNEKRGLRRWQGEINYDEDMVVNRWTGPGSTNKYPSAAGSVNPWNVAKFNTFFVENGSNFCIQNIQVGYTIKNLIPKDKNGLMLRLSLNAERPFDFFTYNGFTTNVTKDGIANGFDSQTYPIASVYSFGIKLIY